jgi:SNF2-related domain/SNF2 Helicase protein/Helicase conserved C-terminal domain
VHLESSPRSSGRCATMVRVIVLHALWSSESRLCIWGEESSLPAHPRRQPGRPPARPRPRPHPFACDPGLLRDVLARLGMTSLTEGAVEGKLPLMLPSSDLGPQCSPQLLRVVDERDRPDRPSRLEGWDVDALGFDAGSALDLLLAVSAPRAARGAPTGPGGGVVVGESVQFLAEAGKLALELVARGRLRPAMVRRGEQWLARWLPVTDDGADAARVALLARCMPPLLRAESSRPPVGRPPNAVLGDLLSAVVDACARELLEDHFSGLGESLSGGAVRAWLMALVAHDPVVEGDPWELAALAEQLDAWWAAGQSYIAQRMFRTCFRLVPPGDGEAEADEDDAQSETAADREAVAEGIELVPNANGLSELAAANGHPPSDLEDRWRVEILLQAKDDPSVLVAAEEVWARSERLSALGRMLENPQERLLGGLGHALALWPDLEPALHEPAPTGVELTADRAYSFLREAVPALEQGGFGVLAPPWWRERMRVKLSANPEQDWREGTGLFGIDGLCAYEWQVAVGDTTLSLSELEALAELKLPLIKARGRWIALRAEDVGMALRFFKGRRVRGRASAGELLREGLGVGGAGSGGSAALDVEIDAKGWLGELMRFNGDRRLEGIETPSSFVGDLRPYQQRGLAWLAFLSSLGLGACLADDMGLGKTVEMLALLLAERERPAHGGPGNGGHRATGNPVGPTLLICPMSVSGNWQREAERFAPSLRVHVHYGRERLKGKAFTRTARAHDLVVTTYALALRDRETLEAIEWHRIVLDEAQNIKTREAKQTRAIRALRARHRVALTGTPVENRLIELHSILDFLNPGLLGSAGSFREQFATPIERWRDGAAAARLRRATGPFILRRLKTDKEIIGDLPEKIEMRVDCHLTREQATLYQAVVDEMLERAEKVEGIERAGIIIGALVKLKQVCNHPAHLLKDRSYLDGRSGKLARLEEILDEALAEGDRALCFTQFAEFGHLLRAHMQERIRREVLFLHGGTPKSARDEMVARFQSDQGPPVFVLSLKAGGTGLNLTAANHVIHYDRWWNPAVEDQATDRAFRIGQRKNVQVRKLTCVGTLEERIDQLIAEKKDLAEQIVGSGEAWLTELDTAQLRELVALPGEAVVAA